MGEAGLVRTLTARRSLTGRVVVLTGATAGIGRATALRLVRRGATVIAVARHPDALHRLAAQAADAAGTAGVAGAGGVVVPHPADLASDADRAELVDRTLAGHGRIDVLVGNVGIGWSGLVEDMTVDQIRSLVETNVIGTIDLARLVLPGMLARREGDLVLTASSASWFATPPLTVYAATKYAVAGFAEGLRREVLARGVRVHSVHPGPVATEFAARSAGDRPGEVAGPPRTSPGIAPDAVAAAIERALTRRGTHVVAVPRLLGLTRAASLPPLRQAADLLIAANATRLAGTGRRLAGRLAGRYAR